MTCTISFSHDADVSAAGAARQELERLSGALPARVLADLALVVTELVTNSVRHARAPESPVRLDVEIARDRLRVEVADGGRGFEPRVRSEPDARESGWGLFVVDALSDRWGVEHSDEGGVVWCELDLELSAGDRRG